MAAPVFFTALSVLLSIAIDGAPVFEPLWTYLLPIDSFAVSTPGKAWSEIAVKVSENMVGGGQTEDTPPSSQELRVHRLPDGVLAEFPCFAGGQAFQITSLFDKGVLSGFRGNAAGSKTDGESVDNSQDENAAPLFEVVFLTGEDSLRDTIGSANSIWNGKITLPSLARFELNGVFYFVSLNFTRDEILETWFSTDGAVLYVYRFELAKDFADVPVWRVMSMTAQGDDFREWSTFSYDNMGNKTGMSHGSGETEIESYRSVYNGNELRSFERTVFLEDGTRIYEHCEPKINKSGIITHMERTVNNGSGLEERRFHEYYYRVDNIGNWLEREEFVFEERYGILVPVGYSLIKRDLIYETP